MSRALVVRLKLLRKARWKRTSVRRIQPTPALKALVYEPFGQASEDSYMTEDINTALLIQLDR